MYIFLCTGQFPQSPAHGYAHQQAAAHYHQQAQAAAAAHAAQAAAAQQVDAGGLDAVAAAAAQDAGGAGAADGTGGGNAAGAAKEGGGPIISQLFVCPQCGKGLKVSNSMKQNEYMYCTQRVCLVPCSLANVPSFASSSSCMQQSQAGLTSHLQHCNPEKIRAELARNPQEKALKISTKRREKWDIKFKELEDYKAEHRNCKVPANDPDHLSLGRWVSSIRREYKKRQEGKKNQLTDERVLKLVSIGFDFSIHGTNWDQKYQELLEYKVCTVCF